MSDFLIYQSEDGEFVEHSVVRFFRTTAAKLQPREIKEHTV